MTTVITDSTSYIHPDLISKYNIQIASLYVTFGEDTIAETEITNKEFYQRMEKEGIPISSQPSIGILSEMMEASLKEGQDIIGIFLSEKFSGTYNTAVLIANELREKYPKRKIKIIDSRSNSMQLGFAALTAAKLAQDNVDFDTIVQKTEENTKKSRFLFIPETLKYLEKGGRIGTASALVGNVLKITPILTVEDGMTEIFKKVRTKKRAIDTMIETMQSAHELSPVQEIAVHHIDRLEEAESLKERLETLMDVNVTISDIGPVIGLHVGPGAIGIVYYTK